MGLVTLETAKEHLKPPGDIDDARIERLIEEASALVLLYVKLPFDAYQNTTGEPSILDVPPILRSAVLLVIGSLYDNADGQDPDKDPLSPAVKSLLHSIRVPTLA